MKVATSQQTDTNLSLKDIFIKKTKTRKRKDEFIQQLMSGGPSCKLAKLWSRQFLPKVGVFWLIENLEN